MSSPRHSPPPSAAAPRPRGILKNASMSSATGSGQQGEGNVLQDGSALSTSPPTQGGALNANSEENHLAWDESNLTLHEIQREQQAARMKIDEPKTPFVRSASFGSMDEDGAFDLDGNQESGYLAPDSQGSSSGAVASGSRRSSAAEELAANTKANAGSGGVAAPAVGLDAADVEGKRRRGESRSPSFTLPNSRRSSAAGERSREGVREEMRNREDENGAQNAMEGVVGDDEEEDDAALDPEAKAKQDAFARKRNAHYGNEAEAMKIAAALAHQDDDEDDEDEDDDMQDQGIPPVPAMPNGRGT